MIRRTTAGLATAAIALTAVVPFAPAVAAPAAPAPAQQAPSTADAQAQEFDLQSHRGGRGEWTEESLTAFAHSMELGVTTLELDTHLTQDDQVVVWHDDTIQPEKCADTAPATPGDPEFPYVGDRVRDLTLAQLQTLDCGYQQLPNYPLQDNIEGNRIATLEQLFDLARQHGAQDIRWNIETKVEDPQNAAERETLVDHVVGTIDQHGWPESTQLQSFDWAALDQARELDPRLELVALAEAENPVNAGIDPQDVADRGYPVWSPDHRLLTQENIAEAHELGLKVVPWTVNNRVDMERLMDWGVDGIITDYPTTLRDVMSDRGMTLPEAYPADAQQPGHRFGRGEQLKKERTADRGPAAQARANASQNAAFTR